LLYRIAICGVMLLFTSYLDIKSREVDDKVWIIFTLLGAGIGAFEYLQGTFDIIPALISLAVGSAIGLAAYYVGFFGGADAKALAVISILIPSIASTSVTPIIYFHPVPALIVLTNSTIIAIILPIFHGLRNLTLIAKGEKIFQGLEGETAWRKATACLLGYRVKGKPKPFLLKLETIVKGKRRFTFEMLGGEEDFVKQSDVWVTPGIPFLVLMAAGYFVLLLWGDIIAIFFLRLLGL